MQIMDHDTDRQEIGLTMCKGRLEILATDSTKDFLTNPEVMADGRTIGAKNTEWLHGALDCWLACHLAK